MGGLCRKDRSFSFPTSNPIKHLQTGGLFYSIVMVVLPSSATHKQTSYAQLLITGLFCLTQTIKCSTFKGHLPQADLGEDHPFTIGLLRSAEYYMRDPGEARGKCSCIPTGCRGRLLSWHREGEGEEVQCKKMDSEDDLGIKLQF